MTCNQESNDKIVKNVPWKEILLSKKVHALWITHMCSAWGYYLLAISLPTFLEEVLNLTVINVRKSMKMLLLVLLVSNLHFENFISILLSSRTGSRHRYLTSECYYLPHLENFSTCYEAPNGLR